MKDWYLLIRSLSLPVLTRRFLAILLPCPTSRAHVSIGAFR